MAAGCAWVRGCVEERKELEEIHFLFLGDGGLLLLGVEERHFDCFCCWKVLIDVGNVEYA